MGGKAAGEYLKEDVIVEFPRKRIVDTEERTVVESLTKNMALREESLLCRLVFQQEDEPDVLGLAVNLSHF